MEVKNILIVAYDMCPYAKKWGDFHRMYLLGKALKEKGHNVTVIHNKKGTKSSFRDLEIPFQTIAIETRDTILLKLVSGNLESRGKLFSFFFLVCLKIIRKLFYPLLGYIDRLLFNDPNPYYGLYGYLWVKSATCKVIDYVQKQKVDITIISAPPFPLHKLVIPLKNKTSSKVVLDYRDPWNLGERNNFVNRKENTYLRKADKVILFSEKFKKDLGLKHKLPAERLDYAYNGFSEENWGKVEEKQPTHSKTIITYTGGYSLEESHYVSVNNFLEAFSKFEYGSNYIIRLVGDYKKDQAQYWKNKLDDKIEFISSVSHGKSIEFMMESHVLVVVYTNDLERSKYMLTTKFFDYLKSGKVIFGIGHSSVNFNEIIRKHKLGLTCENNIKDIISKLNELHSTMQGSNIDDIRENTDLEMEFYSRTNGIHKYMNV